jgi:hypothetical protein
MKRCIYYICIMRGSHENHGYDLLRGRQSYLKLYSVKFESMVEIHQTRAENGHESTTDLHLRSEKLNIDCSSVSPEGQGFLVRTRVWQVRHKIRSVFLRFEPKENRIFRQVSPRFSKRWVRIRFIEIKLVVTSNCNKVRK